MNSAAPVESLDTGEIDSVLERVEAIVDWSRGRGSRLGYFAAMYLRVTRSVKQGMLGGRFQDGPRMGRFDRLFAEHYFRAVDAYRSGRSVAEPWRVAFEASEDSRVLVLQHLLLGMNAHINFDLGLAVREVQPDRPLFEMKVDFDQINQVLFELVDSTQGAVNRVSPLLGLLDWALELSDEALAEFSLKVARDGAWRFAQSLSGVDAAQRTRQRERTIAHLAKELRSPGFPLCLATSVVALAERAEVAEGVDAILNAPMPA